MMKIMVIDNYDSFTYNLVQYLGELGHKVLVYRNDQIDCGKIKSLRPGRIVISPGPGRPRDAGISKEVIRESQSSVPLLGVCLGHQCIAEVYGGKIVKAKRLMHGKTSEIYHHATGLFRGVPVPFEATRYHSLIIRRQDLPSRLKVTAWTRQGEIMGIRHKHYPVFGVQFHPESILTNEGKKILKNFTGAVK